MPPDSASEVQALGAPIQTSPSPRWSAHDLPHLLPLSDFVVVLLLAGLYVCFAIYYYFLLSSNIHDVVSNGSLALKSRTVSSKSYKKEGNKGYFKCGEFLKQNHGGWKHEHKHKEPLDIQLS